MQGTIKGDEMKLFEVVFAGVCALFCAAMIWCAARIDEPFYVCASAFVAAFWGAMAALCVWARISELERRKYKPSIIWPHGRRPC